MFRIRAALQTGLSAVHALVLYSADQFHAESDWLPVKRSFHSTQRTQENSLRNKHRAVLIIIRNPSAARSCAFAIKRCATNKVGINAQK